MGDIITVQMVDKLKIQIGKFNIKTYLVIAMMVVIAIIAIILIDMTSKNTAKNNTIENTYDKNDIFIVERDDLEVNNFIKGYFKARTDLNYNKVFKCFGRDYYKEKRKNPKEVENIEKLMRYERTFVKRYEDIRVFSDKGLKEGDVVCCVAYELALGFTVDTAPMIIFMYLEKSGDSYTIKEKFDVGTSKFISDCMNTVNVKLLYEDTRNRLLKKLTGNENLKLTYNSLRQFEMNMGTVIDYDKFSFIDSLSKIKLDPINDGKYIGDSIIARKKNEEYINNVKKFLGT